MSDTPVAKYDIVNGLGPKVGDRECANGYGCLAALIIKELKDGPGGIYIYPAGSKDCGEEYEYKVRPKVVSERTSNRPFTAPTPAVIEVFECPFEKKPKKLFEAEAHDYKMVQTTWASLEGQDA